MGANSSDPAPKMRVILEGHGSKYRRVIKPALCRLRQPGKRPVRLSPIWSCASKCGLLRACPLRRILRNQFLEPLGLTSGQVARAIGVLPDAVRRISQEEMHLSAKMAVRLGRYFATGPEFWAEVQMQISR